MIVLRDADATRAMGERIAAALMVGDVIGLSGPLGAGKTVLAQGILKGLGHDGDVPSPSFPIVIPYEIPAVRIPVAHVDLYRIDDEGDLRELGLDEWRNDGALVIEWPERLGAAAYPDMLDLSLDVLPDGTRGLTANVPTAWSTRWPIR